MCNEIVEHSHGRIQGEAAPQTCKGAYPPISSELSHFSNLKLMNEEHKSRMKNLSRMHIHPNRICAIRDTEEKQVVQDHSFVF